MLRTVIKTGYVEFVLGPGLDRRTCKTLCIVVLAKLYAFHEIYPTVLVNIL